MKASRETHFEFGEKSTRTTHYWAVYGKRAAVHLHITTYEGVELPEESMGPLGGVEIHYAEAPRYMAGQPPSHEHCRFTGGKCWHDGTSLWASEYWIPLWQRSGNTPGFDKRVFDELEQHRQLGIQEHLVAED